MDSGRVEIDIILPDDVRIAGSEPVVIIGPNGSGKSREARRITADPPHGVEVVNALRNIGLGERVEIKSSEIAGRDYQGRSAQARDRHREMISDFGEALAYLWAQHGDAARVFRDRYRAGEAADIVPTALETLEEIWSEIFPGRRIEWNDSAPIVANESGEAQPYAANQMSDGERSALYLLAKLLLAAPNQVIVVDEPETHLHSQLAISLWDTIERLRPDLRFVYVTHDLIFALSREPAQFLLADPRSGLVPVQTDQGLSAEIRRDILGAASFSYFASRIVFCEGEDHSHDKLLYSAWFRGRDTVVIAAGSCQRVRQAVRSLNDTRIIDNLEAIGIIDRDYQPVAAFDAMEDCIVALPFHEIEGMLCLPNVFERLSDHLAERIPAAEVADIIQGAITDDMLNQTALERMKVRVSNLAQDALLSKPSGWDSDSIRAHVAGLGKPFATETQTQEIFEEELARLTEIRDRGDASEMVQTFPSKAIAAAVCGRIRTRPNQLFKLIVKALSSAPNDASFGALGGALEEVLIAAGFPPRMVPERPGANPAN